MKTRHSMKPYLRQLREVCRLLRTPEPTEFGQMPAVHCYQATFEANRGTVDHIGGAWFTRNEQGPVEPLTPEWQKQLGGLIVPVSDPPYTRRSTLNDRIMSIIEDHLDHRHPTWADQEGSSGSITILIGPHPKISGRIIRRHIATRTLRV